MTKASEKSCIKFNLDTKAFLDSKDGQEKVREAVKKGITRSQELSKERQVSSSRLREPFTL